MTEKEKLSQFIRMLTNSLTFYPPNRRFINKSEGIPIMNICLSISDLFAFLIAIVGILLSFGYIIKQVLFPPKTEHDEGVEKMVTAWLDEDKEKGLSKDAKIDLILKDYETANGEIGRRDNITLIIGTILIGSSFLILGNTAVKPSQPISVYTLASVGLFTIWLLALHDTAKRLNYITYRRIRAVEQALTKSFKDRDDALGYNFGIHSYIDKATEGQTAWWLRLRRTFWAIVLFLLSLAWLLLSVSAKIT
jgi:hypothetical protein